MIYVEGFVAAVPAANKEAYRKHAADAASLIKKFGATRMVETWGDDVPEGKVTDFGGAVQAGPDEVVVFSWFEYPDKAARDAANQKMMSDPRMKEMSAGMPFDGKRMIHGGFEALVDETTGDRGGYVDGFLVPVPAANKEAYRKLAASAAQVFKEQGATRVVEAWDDDVPEGKLTDFRRAVKAEGDEKVVYSWIEWPSKEARNAGMKKAMEDPRMQPDKDAVPFDGRRMIFGGFVPLLDYRRTMMANPHGSYIWYELLTTDPDAATDFYTKVVGWSVRDAGMEGGMEGGMDYRLLAAPDGDVGGLMKVPEGAQMPPCWLGYIGVADVDDTAAKISELGGAVHMPPTDIPGVGRFAMVADRQGVMFYVMRGASDGESSAFKPMAEGHCAWNELVTSNQEAALDFYGRLFGWEKGDAMPMGELGDYRFIQHGGQMMGAVMNRPEDAPPPTWNYYFRVSGIDAAAERIRGNGGTVTFGPMEVPGGDWVVNGIDPQGARFALVGSKH